MDQEMKKLFSTKMTLGYSLLLLLAVILRFNQLSNPMLGEREAAIALQAAGSQTGLSGELPGTSGITALLGLVFFVLGKNEFTARLLPAIFGSLLIFAPLLFRKELGDKTVILLSILFMFDPGFVAFSRHVDGAIITVCGFLFAVGFVLHRRYGFAGIAAGFALLGSSVLWPGVLASGLAFWLTYSTKNSRASSGSVETVPPVAFEKNDLINAGLALILTVGLVGSLFFTRLIGIAAPILNLTAYFAGWLTSTEISPFLILFSFILYQPFILIAGLVEGLRTVRSGDRMNAFLMRWFYLAVLLMLIYPSRGMDSILFAYIPLLVLAARCILRIIESLEQPDIPAWGQMVLVILLVPFSWMNILAIQFPIDGEEEPLRLLASAGALGLLIVASFLIRMGWPPRQGKTGLWMGLAVLIAIFTFSTAWRSAGLGKHPEAELWNYDGITDQMDLLQKTAGDLSEWNVSSREGINIVLLNYSSHALEWSLKDFTSVSKDSSLPNLSNPAIVITADEDVPSLAQAYRGQDFVLNKKTSWPLIMPEEWIKWYAFRELPQETHQVILWARTDLFPGAAKTAPATITPIQ